MILKLKNETTITIEDSSVLGSIKVKGPDPLSIWASFTDDALQEITLLSDDGNTTYASYTDLTCSDSITVAKVGDEYVATFGIRQKTEMELLKEQIAAQQEVIDDLTLAALTEE